MSDDKAKIEALEKQVKELTEENEKLKQRILFISEVNHE
jgi:cell division protein FtsB